MRLLIAPQEFKGSLGPHEVAEAIAAGVRAGQPGWSIDLVPLSDGGPGFIEAIRRAVRSDAQAMVVHDPVGRQVVGRVLYLKGTRDAIIESAQANGLFHLTDQERDPLFADTLGVGEMILEAARAKAPRIIVGVGGSATTDGGAGMARALGARFTDGAGRDLPPGGAPLARLERIEWARPAELEGIEVVVATDVTNPLLGPNGAATIYGPQKGATPEEVDELEAALWRYASVVRRSFGVDLGRMAGAGAAGGLAGGLVAFLGAKVVSGFDVVAEAVGLAARVETADVVITGEGSFDSQSMQGKTTGRVVAMAEEAGKRCVVLAGIADGAPVAGIEVRTLFETEPDRARAMKNAASLVEGLAARWAAEQPAD